MATRKSTRRKAKPSPTVTSVRPESALKITRGALKHRFAMLMHRLEVASDKLDMVVAHYPRPNRCSDGDIGAVVLTREVAKEISALYCEFSDSLTDADLERFGGLMYFPEEDPTAESTPAEARS